MTSTGLMKLLVAEYALIAAVCLIEGNWPRFWYWTGVMIITGSVLWMK